jgi:hypothetical protein
MKYTEHKRDERKKKELREQVIEVELEWQDTREN